MKSSQIHLAVFFCGIISHAVQGASNYLDSLYNEYTMEPVFKGSPLLGSHGHPLHDPNEPLTCIERSLGKRKSLKCDTKKPAR